MERDKDRAAAEQGNGGNQKPGQCVGCRTRIFRQPEIAPVANMQHPQQRPEEDDGRNQESAMEVGLEIVSSEAGQNSVPGKRLCEPEKRRGCQRPEQDDAGEIKQ